MVGRIIGFARANEIRAGENPADVANDALHLVERHAGSDVAGPPQVAAERSAGAQEDIRRACVVALCTGLCQPGRDEFLLGIDLPALDEPLAAFPLCRLLPLLRQAVGLNG